ncbi:hypothetical protein GJ496_009706 [Pomphorhynchus laevis]|nr:hypothetical protein GJ496_009706 [Pomphorhynchus laevis]KAI0985043.1 hypothetical protein GJ496_009706 [Pomphorhynchus laevis]
MLYSDDNKISKMTFLAILSTIIICDTILQVQANNSNQDLQQVFKLISSCITGDSMDGHCVMKMLGVLRIDTQFNVKDKNSNQVTSEHFAHHYNQQNAVSDKTNYDGSNQIAESQVTTISGQNGVTTERNDQQIESDNQSDRVRDEDFVNTTNRQTSEFLTYDQNSQIPVSETSESNPNQKDPNSETSDTNLNQPVSELPGSDQEIQETADMFTTIDTDQNQQTEFNNAVSQSHYYTHHDISLKSEDDNRIQPYKRYQTCKREKRVNKLLWKVLNEITHLSNSYMERLNDVYGNSTNLVKLALHSVVNDHTRIPRSQRCQYVRVVSDSQDIFLNALTHETESFIMALKEIPHHARIYSTHKTYKYHIHRIHCWKYIKANRDLHHRIRKLGRIINNFFDKIAKIQLLK